MREGEGGEGGGGQRAYQHLLYSRGTVADARPSVSLCCSGECAALGLEGTSQGSIVQPTRTSVAPPGLRRRVNVPVARGKKKGELSSAVTSGK